MKLSIYSPSFLQDVLTLLRAAKTEEASLDGLIMQIDQRLGQINASLQSEKMPARVAARSSAHTVQAIGPCPSCKRAPLIYMGELREERVRLFACRACRFSRIEDL